MIRYYKQTSNNNKTFLYYECEKVNVEYFLSKWAKWLVCLTVGLA